MKEVYIKSKEELIAWVKSAGEEIAENAEKVVNQFFPEDDFETPLPPLFMQDDVYYRWLAKTGQCGCSMEEK